MELLAKALQFAFEKIIWLCVFMKQWNAITLVAMIIYLTVAILIVENKIIIKRKTYVNLLIFLLSITFSFISFFMTVATISFAINLVITFIWMVLILFGSNADRQVHSAIYDGGLVFEGEYDGPTSLQILWNGKQEAMKRASRKSMPPARISSGISFSSVGWSFGIPIFPHYWKWTMNATANMEQFYRVQSQLNQYYQEYNWVGARKGKYFTITAYPKNARRKSINFDKKISDALPWYIVPLGSSDSNQMPQSLYVWKMHGDISDLKKCKFLDGNIHWNSIPECPMALVAGGTGGGKSVLLKTIIAHLVSKHDVELYISDPKGGAEFGSLENLNEIKAVAKNIQESYEVFKNFLLQMSKRYNAMGKLGVNQLPLDGMVSLNGYVSADETIFKESDLVHIRFNGEEKDILAGSLQPGMDVVIPENRDFRIPAHWKQLNSENLKIGGSIKFNPMVFIADEYTQLIEGSNDPRDLSMIDEIERAVESISRLGRAANIHIVIATQSPTNSLFPQSLKNNLHFRTICGSVTQDISRMIVGTEEGEIIPTEPIGTYLGYAKGNTALYQGFFTESKTIIKLSKMIKRNKTNSCNESTVKKPITFDIYTKCDASEKSNGTRISSTESYAKAPLKLNRGKIKLNVDNTKTNSVDREEYGFEIVQ